MYHNDGYMFNWTWLNDNCQTQVSVTFFYLIDRIKKDSLSYILIHYPVHFHIDMFCCGFAVKKSLGQFNFFPPAFCTRCVFFAKETHCVHIYASDAAKVLV